MRDAAVCKDAHRSGERVSPDTYRHILDALPYGVLLADPYENSTVYLNAPLQRMVRTTPAQRLEDVNYRTFLPTYQPWQALARAEIAAKEGGHWFTREVRRSDGTLFVTQCLIQPFPLAGERVMMFVLRDLSDPNQDAELRCRYRNATSCQDLRPILLDGVRWTRPGSCRDAGHRSQTGRSASR